MELFSCEKPVVQWRGCHDLDKVVGVPVLNRTAVINIVYQIQSGVNLNRGHCTNESHPLSKHALSDICIPKRYKVGPQKASKCTFLKVFQMNQYINIGI